MLLRKRAARGGRSPRAFLAKSDGAVAVEFVVLAPLVFYIIYAALDGGLFVVRQTMLNGGLAEAVRQIRTDEIGVSSAEKVKAIVCEQAFLLPNCQQALRVRVEVFDDYDAIQPFTPVDQNGEFNAMEFHVSGGEDIVMASAYFKHRTVVPTITGFTPYGRADGSVLLSSTEIVRNEPFPQRQPGSGAGS